MVRVSEDDSSVSLTPVPRSKTVCFLMKHRALLHSLCRQLDIPDRCTYTLCRLGHAHDYDYDDGDENILVSCPSLEMGRCYRQPIHVRAYLSTLLQQPEANGGDRRVLHEPTV